MSRMHGVNVSDFDFASPSEFFEPATVSEAKKIVVGRAATGSSPLRVVSTGLNWGLGSASDPRRGIALMSLRHLTEIRRIDEDLGYAIIEAGVTQSQLTSALQDTTRFLNCTASSGNTSIVGNMMDRGVGVHGQRTDDLLGVEVILPDGRHGSVGWWPDSGSIAANSLGLGPSSLHLFTQSDLGVVTAAAIRLRPRPSLREVVSFTVESDKLRQLIGGLRQLVKDGIVSGVAKVYDARSSALYGGAEAQNHSPSVH